MQIWFSQTTSKVVSRVILVSFLCVESSIEGVMGLVVQFWHRLSASIGLCGTFCEANQMDNKPRWLFIYANFSHETAKNRLADFLNFMYAKSKF